MSNKGLKFHPQALSTAEVEALMAACSPTSPTGKRNRALIVTLWRGALRCEEALHLKVHDLDRADGSVRVMFGKGRKARTVGIEPRAWAVLEVWLAARAERLAAREAWLAASGEEAEARLLRSALLFCTLAGKPLSSRYVRWMMTDLGAKAKLEKRVHAHGLRHTRAAEMAMEGKPLHVISRALGHSNVGTTDRYISHLRPQDVIDAMRDSEWGRDDDG